MCKTLISELVDQYLETLKLYTYQSLDIYAAARAAGNHNRVNFMTGQCRGLSKDSRMDLWSGRG